MAPSTSAFVNPTFNLSTTFSGNTLRTAPKTSRAVQQYNGVKSRRCNTVAVAAPLVPNAGYELDIEVPDLSNVLTMKDFWNSADESKLNTQYSSDAKIDFLEKCTLEEVKNVCIQYRYYIYTYPDNLTYLVRKLPYGELKSLLGEILAEELGSGEMSGAHIVWYDRFLFSIGVTQEELDTSIYSENRRILDQIGARCETLSYASITGMIGMGGECLCQIYLTNMFKHLKQNPHLLALGDKVDWLFWTYHTGEEDIKHRFLVRDAIDKSMNTTKAVQDLTEGYHWGKIAWDRFWTNSYKETSVFTSESS